MDNSAETAEDFNAPLHLCSFYKRNQLVERLKLLVKNDVDFNAAKVNSNGHHVSGTHFCSLVQLGFWSNPALTSIMTNGTFSIGFIVRTCCNMLRHRP